MSWTAFLTLVTATMALVAIPGPNVALFIANTIAHGTRFGISTVIGTTIGVAVQLTIIVIGLTTLLQTVSGAMLWIKWAGVAYLLYLGIQAWRIGANDLETDEPIAASVVGLFWQGLLLAIINPKTLIFSAAFLPQFTGDAPTMFDLMTVAFVYLSIIFIGDLIWVLTAQIARPTVVRLGRLRHRLTGALFIGSGIGLAMARVER